MGIINNFFSNLGETLGFGAFEHVILVVFLLLGIIFYSRDYRLGFMLHFFVTGLLSLWFYNAGWNFMLSLNISIIFFVLMCISLYLESKNDVAGGLA